MNRFDDILLPHNSDSMMQSSYSAHNAFNIGITDYPNVDEDENQKTQRNSSTLHTETHEGTENSATKDDDKRKSKVDTTSLNHLVQNFTNPISSPPNSNEQTNTYGQILDQVMKSILTAQNSSNSGNGNHHNSYLSQNQHFSLSSNTLILNRTITLDELRKYFHLPIAEVAKQFGTCTTALKKICRKLNITKWPYRQILSLTKSIQSLEMAALNEGVAQELRQQYRDQIVVLRTAISEVMKNPSKAMETLNQHLEFTGALIGEANLPPEGTNEQEALSSEDLQRMVKASTSTASEGMTNLDATERGSSYRRSSKNGKRSNEFLYYDPNENSKLKRSKSEDGNLSTMVNDASGPQAPRRFSIGGVVVHERERPPTENRDIHEPSRPDQSSERNPPSSSTDPSITTMLPRSENVVAHAWSQYLLDVGLTTVQVNYNPELHKYHFTGQVQLAPLHRRKVRPSSLGKVVPLMEPDIGSSYSVDFFPKLTLGKL